ncbi:MAG: hypothetical protein QM754_04220 [Tepidisphaeraceae bacterium]
MQSARRRVIVSRFKNRYFRPLFIGTPFAMRGEAHMFGLRQKLTFGYLGLLGILLTVGVLSGVSLHRYRSTLERIFRENYDSVLYGQQMKAAVESLDAIALSDVAGTKRTAAADPAKSEADFEAALAAETGNVTLLGEQEIVDQIHRVWLGVAPEPSYVASIHAILAADDRDSKLANYREVVQPRTALLREATQRIVDMNVHNMGFENGEVQNSAVEATRTLYSLIAAGVLFGGAFVFLVARSILRQLGAVSASRANWSTATSTSSCP